MQRFRFARFAPIVAAAAALVGCDGAASPAAPSPSPAPVITAVSPTASATVEARPPRTPRSPPPTSGPRSEACVDGWHTPPEGDPLREAPLRVIRRTSGWRGPFVVVDMRYFTGPESPPDPEKGYLRVVQRWYVKGYMRREPALQGRFLVERRRFGSGLAAVAPYDTTGWRSPDWIGFQLDTADPTPRTYPGLPGQWAGIPYDFVEGGERLRFPGVPAAVVGCLADT
jgi:hypothetical protein